MRVQRFFPPPHVPYHFLSSNADALMYSRPQQLQSIQLQPQVPFGPETPESHSGFAFAVHTYRMITIGIS